MNVKKSLLGFSVIAGLLLSSSPAFAHVVVTPNEAGAAQPVNFTVGVPTEEDVPTVGLRIVIPEGVDSVTPNVKPGWNIEIKKGFIGMKGEILNTGERAPERVTEIIWSGGSIPAGQRDEFVFRALTPANESELVWRAYQTYEGGNVVAWDADPKAVEEYEKNNPAQPGQHDDKAPLPYSVTKVVNDLKAVDSTSANNTVVKTATDSSLPTVLSIAAIIMSAGALFFQMRKKR